MIGDIIKGIGKALLSEFGEGYGIYTEEIRQGLTEPCFFIFMLEPESRVFLGKRYFRTHPFVIQYLPGERANTQEECTENAERMLDCLEYITLPGEDQPIRGTEMRFEIQEGVLQFFVNYDLFLYQPGENSAMEELHQSSLAR